MKNLRWVFLLVAAVALVSFGSAIYSVVAETDWNGVLRMSVPEMLEHSPVAPLAAMLAVMIFVLVILHSVYRTIFPAPIPNGVRRSTTIRRSACCSR
jgi:hypothetical protein